MTESPNSELREKLRQSLERESDVELAYLFGSAAGARVDKANDVDVAVGLVGFADPLARLHTLGLIEDRLRRALGRPVDVVDLYRAPPVLLHEILRVGRPPVLVRTEKQWSSLRKLCPQTILRHEAALRSLRSGGISMSLSTREVVADRLRHLREYLSDLRSYQDVTWEDFTRDKVLRRFVERTLHLATESCLDVGNHLISAQGYREPEGNRDVFQVLEEAGALEPELAAKMKDMASFRNIIVHAYTRIDPAIVYGVLQRHLDDLAEFAEHVQNLQT